MYRAHTLPSLEQLLSCQPTDLFGTCKHLDVGQQTIRRWRQAGTAPRVASLALFYESAWGYSLLETTAYNGAMFSRREVESLRNENIRLKARIAYLERLSVGGHFGSANDPLARTL